jgi:circadian clock protein KaiC
MARVARLRGGKMRGGNHSKDIRQYEISSDGIVLGQLLQGYEQVITGVPIAKQRD